MFVLILASDCILKDALNQISACFVLIEIGRPLTEENLLRSREHLLEVGAVCLQGNPYPGRNFSLEKGREFLELVKLQPTWTVENLSVLWRQLYDFLKSPEDSSCKSNPKSA
jgi:hypothetical protein